MMDGGITYEGAALGGSKRFRDFGRRTVLLHLSGFPCRYQRRVVGTKSTTSKPLLSYS